ncbi:hypothetical protein VULLAG_LOCUS2404 [Vulpes lagopus]
MLLSPLMIPRFFYLQPQSIFEGADLNIQLPGVIYSDRGFGLCKWNRILVTDEGAEEYCCQEV